MNSVLYGQVDEGEEIFPYGSITDRCPRLAGQDDRFEYQEKTTSACCRMRSGKKEMLSSPEILSLRYDQKESTQCTDGPLDLAGCYRALMEKISKRDQASDAGYTDNFRSALSPRMGRCRRAAVIRLSGYQVIRCWSLRWRRSWDRREDGRAPPFTRVDGGGGGVR